MAEEKKRDSLADARKQIRQRIQAAQEAEKLTLKKGRLDLAAKGAQAFASKNLGEAATAFLGYLRMLEQSKGQAPGGLSPALFDRKKEGLADMMLIAGVYWELIKLFDRTTSAEKHEEFKKYLAKYILFAKGLPYQTMCSEVMRRYLHAGQAVHKEDFKAAYKTIAVSKCFVATELVEYVDGETLADLRAFRDQTLKKNELGRRFVAWYYRKGPAIADRVSKWPEPLRHISGMGLSGFALAYRSIVPVRKGRK